MNDPVHILVTVRKVELLQMAQLVFRTLRTGFPSALVTVHLNDLSGEIEESIKAMAFEQDCVMINCKQPVTHHEWIEDLCSRLNEAFWICDTDLIFYDSIEQFQFKEVLTGWRVPQWNDEFSGCITRARLHTSLLRIDPIALRDKVKQFFRSVPDTVFTPKANVFYPLVVPFKGRKYFSDTCSLLYHAVGGEAFQPKHKNAYMHFQFGTIEDLVLPRLANGAALAEARKRIIQNPSLGHGVWREFEDHYSQRAA